MEEPKDESYADPNRETAEASSPEYLVQMKEPLLKRGDDAVADEGERTTARSKTVSATDEPVAGNRFVFGGFVTNFISQLQRETARLKAAGKASAASLSRLSNSRTPRSFYAPDPFAVDPGYAVDRSGRPLPWRWKRSLSRDLLGHYGLMFAGAAVVIAALAYIIPNTPNGPVGRAELPIQKPSIELPQTPPSTTQAQAPNPPQSSHSTSAEFNFTAGPQTQPPNLPQAPASPPQAQAPNLPQTPASPPQAQAPNLPQTAPKTPQVVSPNLPVQIGPPNPSSASAPPTLPPSKLGPRQQAPSTQKGKGSAAKVPPP
jgi:hypothetical protein